MNPTGKARASCAHCRREFPVYPSRLKFGGGRYCGNECRYAAVREKYRREPGTPKNPQECVCIACGVRFVAEAKDVARGRGQFHSTNCWYVWQRWQTITQMPVRFWAKVEKTDGCWWWRGGTTRAGYGSFGRGQDLGGTIAAHRLSWEMANGPITAGLFVCHRCDNKLCVNPNHLFLGTPSENVADMHRKGRAVVGAGRANALLTWEQAREIRALHAAGAESYASLARRFGVPHTVVSKVVRGLSYKGSEEVEADGH